mgnify:CR=1 FL=1
MTIGYIPTIEERVADRLEDGSYTLFMCPHAWALRHQLVNQETGETVRMRCGSWSCPYCGPRKVNEWRQLIAESGPTMHLTLTKAGKTVEEAARALTTFMQALRRGSKRKGREAYPVEYFAVLERHENFEENGFHWHILLKGMDYIPYKEVIEPLWHSATHGISGFGWIDAIKNSRAIGYVTKYLTKDILRKEQGTREVERVVTGLVLNEAGQWVEQACTVTEEVTSQARRIRYSRNFFPESTKELRARLFAGMNGIEETSAGQEEQGQGLASGTVQDEQGGDDVEVKEPRQAGSPWRLQERCPVLESVGGYAALLRHTLTEVLTERVAQGKRLSRRVLTVWNYQREYQYSAGGV